MPHVDGIHAVAILGSAATAAPLPRLPSALGVAMCALAQRVDTWREATKRAAQDRDALANMSDRDLKDIGITRACVDAVADDKWTRDYPY